MRNKLILIFLFISNIIICQTPYENGFYKGYKQGFCYIIGPSCIEPIPPIAPIPRVSESLEHYMDGYNRGFKRGLDAGQKQKPSYTEKENENTDNIRYQTSASKFVEDKMFKIDYNDVVAIAQVLREMKAKAFEYYNNAQYNESIEVCLQGIKINYKDSEFLMLAGSNYEKLGDIASAIKYLQSAYRFDPSPNLKYKIEMLKN